MMISEPKTMKRKAKIPARTLRRMMNALFIFTLICFIFYFGEETGADELQYL
jgi:hypothetical protein